MWIHFSQTEHLSCLIYIHMWCADRLYEAILFVHAHTVWLYLLHLCCSGNMSINQFHTEFTLFQSNSLDVAETENITT